MKPVYQIEKDNKKIEIYYDPYVDSPRVEMEHDSTLATFHRNYSFGDKDKIEDVLSDFNLSDAEYERAANARNLDEVTDLLEKHGAIVLPVYMYDHSGITLSTTPFSCSWDSGQLGFIYVTREGLKNWFPTWKRLTFQRIKAIKTYLVAEIDVMDKYIKGEVYGFKAFKDGEEVDSCWGFYDLRDIAEYLPEEFEDLWAELVKKENF